jgi:tRNA (uracil-5-)-methyltransferase
MNVIRALRKTNKKLRKSAGSSAHMFIEIKDTLPSPVLTGYRNKNEFTIGLDADGQPNVGFVNGNFKNGTVRVDNPDNCTIVSPVAL